MKRYILTLVVISTLLIISACGGSVTKSPTKEGMDKSGEEITLKAITPSDFEDYFQEVADDFKEETGVTVEIQSVAWDDLISKMTNAMVAGGTAYDILVVDDIYLAKFAEAGWVVPVDAYLSDELKGDFTDFTAQLLSYKDEYYGLPWYSSWKTMAYNKDYLKEIGVDGPPQTWNDFIDVSVKLQDKDIVEYASAWSWNREEALIVDYITIAATMGGEMFDENNDPVFDNDEGIEALQLMVDMLDKHKIVDPSSIQFNEGNVEEEMSAGNVAFELQWGVPTFNHDDPEVSDVVDQTEMFLMPEGITSATVATSAVQSISYGSENPEEAWKFIEFMNGPEGTRHQLEEVGGTNLFPGYTSLIEDPDISKSFKGYDVVLEQGEFGIIRPQLSWYQEWSNIMQVQLQMALMGTKTPEEALKDAKQETLDLKSEVE